MCLVLPGRFNQPFNSDLLNHDLRRRQSIAPSTQICGRSDAVEELLRLSGRQVALAVGIITWKKKKRRETRRFLILYQF